MSATASNTVVTEWIMQRDRYLEGLRDINVQTQATVDRFNGTSIQIGIEGYDGLTPVAEQAVADAQALEAQIPIVGLDGVTSEVDRIIEENDGKTIHIAIEGDDETGGADSGGGGGGLGGGRIARMAGMMMLYAGLRGISEKIGANQKEDQRMRETTAADSTKQAEQELAELQKQYSGASGAATRKWEEANYNAAIDAAKEAGTQGTYSDEKGWSGTYPGAAGIPMKIPDSPDQKLEVLQRAVDNAKQAERDLRASNKTMGEGKKDEALAKHEQEIARIDAMQEGSTRDRAVADEKYAIAKDTADKINQLPDKNSSQRSKEYLDAAAKIHEQELAKANELSQKEDADWRKKMDRDAQQYAAEFHKDAAEDARLEKHRQASDAKISREAEALHAAADRAEEEDAKKQERGQNMHDRNLARLQLLESRLGDSGPSFSSDPFQTWTVMQQDKDRELKDMIAKLSKQLDNPTIFGAVER